MLAYDAAPWLEMPRCSRVTRSSSHADELQGLVFKHGLRQTSYISLQVNDLILLKLVIQKNTTEGGKRPGFTGSDWTCGVWKEHITASLVCDRQHTVTTHLYGGFYTPTDSRLAVWCWNRSCCRWVFSTFKMVLKWPSQLRGQLRFQSYQVKGRNWMESGVQKA